jgi:predicted ATP-dependent protease
MSFDELKADEVRARIDPSSLPCDSSDALPPVEFGEAAMRLQPRARAALDVAIATRANGFHVFAVGSAHLGKVESVMATLRAGAAVRPPADDWVYVFNETDPTRPHPVRLPSGTATAVTKAVDQALSFIERELPRVLHGGRFRKLHADLMTDARARESRILAELRPKIRKLGFDVRQVRGQLEAKPLGKTRRALLGERLPKVSEIVEETNRRLVALMTEVEDKQARIDETAAREVATRALDPVRTAWESAKELHTHLNHLLEALVENHPLFLLTEHSQASPKPELPQENDPLLRFRLHVFVSHHGETAAPTIRESQPSASNLFGAILRKAESGVLTTDFTQLQAGALHRANGGFLVLGARSILAQDGVWGALKQALRTRSIRLQEVDEQVESSTAHLSRPEPLPLDCVVVLTGEPEVFEALYEADPDFRELFGLRADFDDGALADAAGLEHATCVLSALIVREQLPAFDRAALAAVMETSLVLSQSQTRLSVEWDRIRLVLLEAALEARKDRHECVTAEHVGRARRAAAWRDGLLEEHLRDDLRRGVLRTRVTGEIIGQVNAIALQTLGDSVYGRPSRVTAQVGPGARGIIDIERQVNLAGPVHSKAVLLLQGFLLGRFGRERPLALEATLTFEQSYGLVEGDSASVAELAALLSATAEVPIRQALAVTCALGQDGYALPVGGVTRKIEAFHDACRVLGFDDHQGVIIARSNVQHLMLRDDVVESISANRFHVYAVDHVDEALELLTRLTPANLSAKVSQRLEAFSRSVRQERSTYLVESSRVPGPPQSA